MNKETYTQTTSWLPYRFDTEQAAVECGWLLGQVCARVSQVCRSILPPVVAAELRADIRVRGIAALAALAGNSLGERALRQLLAGQLEVPPSREYLRQELVNLLAAESALSAQRAGATPSLTTSSLLALHATLLRDLNIPGSAPVGALRRAEQEFNGYRGVAPADIAPLLERLSAWLEELRASLHVSFGRGSDILRAILAHRYLTWIRPFPAANARVARLVEQDILRRSGVPATVALLLPIHYDLTRSAYAAQLRGQPGAQDDESVFAFLRYALQGLYDGLEELVNGMDESQLTIHWARHIDTILGEDERTTSDRKWYLIQAISEQDSAIKREDIAQLSPSLAAAYALVSERTLRRDIRDLLHAGLLEETQAGLRARKEQLYAFLDDVQ